MIGLLNFVREMLDWFKPINWFLSRSLLMYTGLIIVRRSAALPIGAITLILLPIFFLPIDYLDAYNPVWYIKVALWLLVYILGYIQKIISQVENEVIQQNRVQQVEKLKEKILGVARPRNLPRYCLFLKPSAIQHLDTQTEGHVDLEDILRLAIHPIHLIPLEKSAAMTDTQQTSTANLEWQAKFAKFAIHARSILFIPHPDMLWEIKWLIQHKLLSRSIWLMPETPGWSSPGGAVQYVNYEIPTVFSEAKDTVPSISISEEEKVYDFTIYWSRVSNALREVDIKLPPYQARGMFFLIDDNGTASAFQPVALSATAFRVRKIRRALKNLHDPHKSSKESAYAPPRDPGLFSKVKETLLFTLVSVACLGYGLYQEVHSGFSWSMLVLIVFGLAFLIPLIAEITGPLPSQSR